VRREQVEESLKEVETRRKNVKSPPLSLRISQAGLSWSKRQFLLISAGLGLVALAAAFGMGLGLLPALGLGFAAGFGLPRWLLSFLKKRRERRFIEGFADAVDVIVRGVKAGLPLGDCLKVIASDAQEPVKSEFRGIVETQTIGMPLGEACTRLYESMPLPEANFFGIVISIQQKAGGNLSETLGNLSRVLRDRKKMQAKIRAMSMEAKASATIIGCLPIAVMILVYITSPTYIELLWTTPMGRLMLAACVTWMAIGVFVMKKMINFDF
jgi:tight adherence protein B